MVIQLTGCALFRVPIDTGTEAAKLLLANERLDEGLLGSKINIGLTGGMLLSAKDHFETMKLPSNTMLSTDAISASTGRHTWDSFPAESSSLTEFNQFMESVDWEVKNVAEDIANMKQYVGVTDKWVQFLNGDRQMLRVFENYDCLLVCSESGDVHVYYRYTDENARNYYEMYSFMKYEDGTTGDIRTLYVPNERYEYMYENSGGFKDYFVAENSRGYWVSTRFGIVEYSEASHLASFSTYIVKDGLGYGFYTDYQKSGDSERRGTGSFYVFDPELDRELFCVHKIGSRYDFDLYFSAIKDGFVSVSASQFRYDEEYGVYDTNAIDTLVTKNGTYTASKNGTEGQFDFTNGYVQYDYGNEIYYGSLSFGAREDDLDIASACDAFGRYIEGLGLTLWCDMETVTKSLEHASLMAEGFSESFRWYDNVIRDTDALKDSIELLRKDYKDKYNEYEEVKDFESVNVRQVLSPSAHFASVNITAGGDNKMNGETIQIGGIIILTEDVSLFEVGKRYVIKVGLSLVDENGNPISVNTVALKGAEGDAVIFEGEGIGLSISGEYAIPKNLHSGRYAAVVYVATADEGIRVSEMKKIGFTEIKEGEIESSAMIMEAFDEESSLVIDYKIKNTRTITVVATKESYGYDEIERMIIIEILAYGTPFIGATLEGQNGEAIGENDSLGKGNYRMMCYFNTSDGLAQGYVYLILE